MLAAEKDYTDPEELAVTVRVLMRMKVLMLRVLVKVP